MMMPKKRKGIDNSQIMGVSSRTKNARGQQITNRMAQRISVVSIFISYSLHRGIYCRRRDSNPHPVARTGF